MTTVRKTRDKPLNRARRAMARKLPFLKKFYRSIADYFHRRAAARLLRRIGQDPGARAGQIAMAITALDEAGADAHDGWPQRIEVIRKELLADDTPLVDGRFGEAGIYDGGGRTIGSCCTVSKPPRAALFLYCLVRALGSTRVLELGTNLGISAAYLAAGMQRHGGRLVTCESSPYRQDIARRIHKRLGLTEVDYVLGMFSDTLDKALADIGPVDLAFIDGHHQYQPTLDYMNQIIPHAAPGCVMVFDDIRWSDGMVQAWTEIKADSRFELVVDLDSVGVCVLGSADTKRNESYGPADIF